MFKKNKKISESKYLEHKLYAKSLWKHTILGGVIFVVGGIFLFAQILSSYLSTSNVNVELDMVLKLLIIPLVCFIGGIGLIIYAIRRKSNFKEVEKQYLEQLYEKPNLVANSETSNELKSTEN